MRKITSAVLALTVAATGVLSTGCGGVDSNFSSDYVAGILDASYKGEFNNYIKMTDATEEDAQEIYDGTVDYFASALAYYCEVYTDDISEELYAEYTALAADLLKEAKYTIASAESGKESCYVKVSIKPLNLLEQIEDDITECVDVYNEKLEEIGAEALDSMSDEEYLQLEEEYARSVLDAIKSNAENLEYKDNVDFTMEIIIDEEGCYGPANEDDWNTIDDYIMGLS
ncbi:MAG: hypothetical protein IJ512_03065 [Ruminococcus sp.]|nr:hypothetical protein [Ruminococcus sp.]